MQAAAAARKQLSRVEGVWTPIDIGIENDLRFLDRCLAAMRVNPPG
jgi:hypothetical protein